MKAIVCDACGKLIVKEQYVYEIKLDNGAIKESHGGNCTEVFAKQISRLPIQQPDWWIRQVPNPLDVQDKSEGAKP